MKKKGFTLIELLAVIIVLAIIFMIAIPQVLDTIEVSRKGSAEKAAYGYVDAIELNNVKKSDENHKTYTNGKYDVSDIVVDFKGTSPTKGYVLMEKDTVTEGGFCINNYWVEYKDNDSKAIGKCSDLFGTINMVMQEGIDKIYFEVEDKKEEVNESKSYEYRTDTEITYYATPSTGYTYNECTKDTPCTLKLKSKGFDYKPKATINTYEVVLNGTNVTIDVKDNNIKYNGNIKATLTPEDKYYFESMTCTNGYTTTLNIGTKYYTPQTITINNNKSLDGSICTVTTHLRSYEATKETKGATACIWRISSSSSSSGECADGTTIWYGLKEWSNTYTDDCGTSTSGGQGNCGETKSGCYSTVTGCPTPGAASGKYKCDSGWTKSGKTCYRYICPNGGTLNGTTCTFE